MRSVLVLEASRKFSGGVCDVEIQGKLCREGNDLFCRVGCTESRNGAEWMDDDFFVINLRFVLMR